FTGRAEARAEALAGPDGRSPMAFPEPPKPPHRRGPSWLRLGAIGAGVAVFVSPLPAVLIPAGINAFLMIAAVTLAGMALWRREKLWQSRFTLWDEAAAVLMVAIAVGFTIDEAAVVSTLHEMQGTR
ncbi:MAG: hypothetical protein ACPGNT_11605, partial [Rhodospirillales bacterium]